jgi:hypothetical protein
MTQPDADRNLLVGVLALHLDFIGRDQFVAALNAWAGDKKKPLGQVLIEQGALADAGRDALEVLADRHLECHEGQARHSLQSLEVGPEVWQGVASIADSELPASLTVIAPMHPGQPANLGVPGTVKSPTDLESTTAVGAPTAYGQRFVVLRPHAEGGLGRVSVARDQELGRDVALKEIKPTFAHDTGARARFLREAELTGGLEHPGVVPVYALGRFADGRPYYAMRFIQGESLEAAIRRFHGADWRKKPGERQLALRGLLRRFVDVCNAVAYAHGRGSSTATSNLPTCCSVLTAKRSSSIGGWPRRCSSHTQGQRRTTGPTPCRPTTPLRGLAPSWGRRRTWPRSRRGQGAKRWHRPPTFTVWGQRCTTC